MPTQLPSASIGYMNFRNHAAVLVGLSSLVAAGWSATSSAASSERWQSVTFDGVSVSVPASWPVISFAKHPQACPRLDVHAVYLGTPGQNPICPAGLVGKTNAVMIEPLSKSGQAAADRMVRQQTRQYSGAKARSHPSRILALSHNWPLTRTITDLIPDARAEVNISFGADRALALAIQRSLHVTTTAAPTTAAPTTTATPTTATTTTATSTAAAPTTATPTTAAPTAAAPTAAAPTATATTAAMATPITSGQGLFTGSGFDACAAPSSSAMTSWLNSPYRAIGIYIGGANRACAQANLSPSWINSIVAQGWHYFPIYPGLQSSCVQAVGDATITTSQANAEGEAAADDAVAQATNLGIPAGTPLIYDMEAYGPRCNSQVTTFLSAWDSELQARGYVSGVYESFTNIGALVSAAGSMTEPQVIYYADWDGVATTNSSYMPGSMWANHQRLHQYQGGHLETWGGVSIDIDTDKLDLNLGSAPATTANYEGFRISVGMNTNGTAEWFARTSSDTLSHSWQAPVGSLTWSAMHAVGRTPATFTSNPAVAALADGALTIFARSSSGQLMHAWQQAGYPNDWEWGSALPALTSPVRPATDPAAVLMPSGVVGVFQTEANGNVAAIAQSEPNRNGRWTNWTNIGGQCASTPVPLVDASHHVDLFCRTTANSVAAVSWNGTAWGRWSTLTGSPTNLAGVPSAVVNGAGQTELFAATKSGGLDDAWLGGTGTWTWPTPLAGSGSGRRPAATSVLHRRRRPGRLAR